MPEFVVAGVLLAGVGVVATGVGGADVISLGVFPRTYPPLAAAAAAILQDRGRSGVPAGAVVTRCRNPSDPY